MSRIFLYRLNENHQLNENLNKRSIMGIIFRKDKWYESKQKLSNLNFFIDNKIIFEIQSTHFLKDKLNKELENKFYDIKNKVKEENKIVENIIEPIIEIKDEIIQETIDRIKQDFFPEIKEIKKKSISKKRKKNKIIKETNDQNKEDLFSYQLGE